MMVAMPRKIALPATPNERAANLTGRPHLTFSEARTFQGCPLKWHFQYREKAKPEQLSSAMLLGTCVHAAIQQVMEAIMACDHLPTIDGLMETYRKTWDAEAKDIPMQFSKGQDVETSEATAKRMIETFLTSDLACPQGEIIGIEENFRITLSDDLPDLAGRIDLVTHENGILWITDFKTARSVPDQEAAEEAGEQLILYAQGCQPIANQLGATIRLQFLYINKTKEPKVEASEIDMDSTRIHRSKLILRQIFKAMESDHIYPAPSPINCGGCAFRKRCMTWNENSN